MSFLWKTYFYYASLCKRFATRRSLYWWKFRTRKPPLISALVKVSKITFCLYYYATVRGRFISMFRGREKFIALIRQAVDKEKPIRFASSVCAGRSGWLQVLMRSVVNAAWRRSDRTTGKEYIEQKELSILLCDFFFFSWNAFYDCVNESRIKMKQTRQVGWTKAFIHIIYIIHIIYYYQTNL